MKWLLRIMGVVVLLIVLAWAWVRFSPEPGVYQLTAADRAFADSITVPPMPADWSWGEFESYDGTTLRWGQTGNRDSAVATMVYVPGYNGTIEAYGEQFDLWARRGLHVVGLDMRAQGGSEGQLGHDKLPRFNDAQGRNRNAADIVSFLETLPRDADRPVILVGSSYGALATTLALREAPEAADGYLAIAPAYQPKLPSPRDDMLAQAETGIRAGLGDRYAPGQGPWQPFTTKAVPPAFCPTDHPRIFLQLAIHGNDPDQRVGGLTWGVLRDWIAAGDELAADGAVATPMRMVLSTDDAMVENGPAKDLCEVSASCSYESWDDATHCVTLDNNDLLERVADEVVALADAVRG